MENSYKKALFKVIEEIGQQLVGAQLMTADEFGYGSMSAFERAAQKEHAIKAIYDSIPKGIHREFAAAQNKARANRLRREADAIEAGRDQP